MTARYMSLEDVLNRLMELKPYYGDLELVDVSQGRDCQREENWCYVVVRVGYESYLINFDNPGGFFTVTQGGYINTVETDASRRLHGLLLGKKRNEAGELV